MRRVRVLALVALALLAGCPAGTSTGGTVTPAPVATPPATATPAPCAIPEPTASGATPQLPPPPRNASVPVENGTVNASALIDRHDRVLRRFSYRLRAPGLAVALDPRAGAVRVRARSNVLLTRHYIVNGTEYTFRDGPGGQEPYQVHSEAIEGIPAQYGSYFSLTGRNWLSAALAVGQHRPIDREAAGRTILAAEVTDRVAPGVAPEDSETPVRTIESTVAVDRRGIVRSVEQHVQVSDDGGDGLSFNRSLTVSDVGSTTVQRPSWVCDSARLGLFEDA